MKLFTVEIDYTGTYQAKVEAESDTEAYREAMEDLEFDSGDGDRLFRKSESFQVYDERMIPCDVNLEE